MYSAQKVCMQSSIKIKDFKIKKSKNKKNKNHTHTHTHTHTQKKSYDFQTTVIYFSTKPGGADGSS